MMTQKHYIVIADDIARENRRAHREGEMGAVASIDRLVSALCVTFKKDNKNFDKERFRTATGTTK